MTLTRAGVRRPRGSYRKGVERRRQIVRAASAVFAEHGYWGGSIRAIAERVDASSATLDSVLRKQGRSAGGRVGGLERPARSVRERADADGLAYVISLRTLMAFHVENPRLTELLLTMAAEASSETHPARSFVQLRYARMLDDLRYQIDVAADRGEVRLASTHIAQEARMLVAMMDGLELQWLADPQIDLLPLFDTYLDDTIIRWRSIEV